ncbi:Imm51 family immunity protein [Methanobrevibacter filiformis]|uniref:Immunity protein 51 n=1 Tax=Methanobrevibacter filiformis TaxID=55758 RepID=A0A166DAI8_9EURY|nr:Imm51 family immunity protein [Methanobrevibacter filiformis]KZX15381.1 hypothetical protein MBFIL_06820 [Methanobrevibacter filiformis]
MIDINEIIKPFRFLEYEDRGSLILNVGEYLNSIFELRADEGFEGNGYDWGSLALVFLNEEVPHLKEDIGFDPEGSMFCVYSKNLKALKEFAVKFHEACEDEELIKNLFLKAELD